MDIKKEYARWLEYATADQDVAEELKRMDEAQIEDAFYRDLAFGTGGLRGVIGAGTNRMNIYTVAKASHGLADYLNKNYKEPSVVIGYDSRIKSDVFAKVAAGVFAANGIQVHIWPTLMPVPTVSFATRYLGASAGLMITASHNPSKYNGYKVYGADGCQITTEAAAEVLAEIEKLDIFTDVKQAGFAAGMEQGMIQYIPDQVYTAFVEAVRSSLQGILSVCAFVVFFYVAARPLSALGGTLGPVLVGVTELFSLTPLLPNSPFGLVLAAGAAGWGGVSVLCQTAAVLDGSGLRIRPCLVGKAVHGLLSAGLAALLAGYILS